MKKTLAIILSIVMLFGVMPFAVSAADSDYDRAAVAANDEAYIADMTAEQMASVILDWADREIAEYTAEATANVVDGILAGFDAFEASFLEEAIYANIPVIDSLDDVIGYKNYLTELGGDFAKLDATNLITREEAGSAIGFIEGVFQFMADNSELFGKVFRWDGYVVDESGAVTDYGNVFDYGAVGDYIETLNGSEDADEQAIYDFYIDYLVGNDIQAKFTKWIADQMGYEIPEGETFDDTLNNGIMAWFSGICEDNGILSEEGLAALRAYDLRTTDIYTLIENFVGLVQSDNQVKIDTYYNFIFDSIVRSLLKASLGKVPSIGEATAVPEDFTATYTNLALLEEISGGTVFYQDAEKNYYEVTVADGEVTAKTLVWEDGIDLNLEPVYAAVSTGADRSTAVKTYEPKSTDISISTYASQKNQNLVSGAGLTFTGTEVPAEIATLMNGNATALTDGFLIKVTQGEKEISSLDISFEELETEVKEIALTAAQDTVKATLAANNLAEDSITVGDINFNIIYNVWTTDDEFVCAVDATDLSVTLSGSVNSFILGIAQAGVNTAVSTAVGNIYDTPIATIVVDGLAGGGADYFGKAEALLDFIDTDFAIDADLLDFAGNYDAYNGVVGQVNHILYGLVDMLVSDSGMAELALTDGNNDNLYANLEKICATANDMMTAAEEIMNDEGLQEMLANYGVDFDALVAELPLDLLYIIDFSSVEALYTSIIGLGLDIIDNGENADIAEIHTALDGLTNLDGIAVATADYLLDKCIPAINDGFAENDVDFALTVPVKTDAKTVADGAGKDILMTKAVDLLYEAANEGVALVNTIINDIIADAETESEADLPTVAFKLGVEKGATWQATLSALVDRTYELAGGFILACDNDYTDTFDRISAVANAVLPLGSLASNCAGNGFAFDINKVMGFLFDDGLEGDFDGFLRLFETKVKTEDVAADVSVTEALIMTSEHIVDAVFPDTVKSELYVNLADYSAVSFTETTVQEYFTSSENDAVIASNNMDSLNARKAELIPAALNLVRESGILPFFAKCDKDHSIENLVLVTEKVDSTCAEVGHEAIYECADCGYRVGGEEIAKKAHSMGSWAQTKAPTCDNKGLERRDCSVCDHYETRDVAAKGHSFGAWTVTTAPTCEANGVETRTCGCGKTETRNISATGHADNNGDGLCDACGKDLNPQPEEDNSFFGKIKAFFQKIIDWFKNLFKF